MPEEAITSYREVFNCRSCGSESLISILDLGEAHINAFPKSDEPNSPKAPLDLLLCSSCQLVQLRHTTNCDLLYRQFFYRSSITQTMQNALKDVVEGCIKRAPLGRGDLVIDIGSNDSTLLSNYPHSVQRVGFEPAENLMTEARKPGLTVVNDYFTAKSLSEVTGMRAKIITAIAMFYDLDQPNKFLEDVRSALSSDGIFCIQQAYLPEMLRLNDISNVTHEHLEYYSLTSLEPLLRRHGLCIFDVEQNSINGGSFRTYIGHQGRFTETDAVKDMRFKEQALGLDTALPYLKFAERSRILRGQVRKYLLDAKAAGKKVYGYGASTKAQTLIHYWDLGEALLPSIADRDPRKFGRHMVNGGISITAESSARADASAFLVFPFFFKKEFLERERDWILRGGEMVFPLPEFCIVSAENLGEHQVIIPRPK